MGGAGAKGSGRRREAAARDATPRRARRGRLLPPSVHPGHAAALGLELRRRCGAVHTGCPTMPGCANAHNRALDAVMASLGLPAPEY